MNCLLDLDLLNFLRVLPAALKVLVVENWDILRTDLLINGGNLPLLLFRRPNVPIRKLDYYMSIIIRIQSFIVVSSLSVYNNYIAHLFVEYTC